MTIQQLGSFQTNNWTILAGEARKGRDPEIYALENLQRSKKIDCTSIMRPEIQQLLGHVFRLISHNTTFNMKDANDRTHSTATQCLASWLKKRNETETSKQYNTVPLQMFIIDIYYFLFWDVEKMQNQKVFMPYLIKSAEPRDLLCFPVAHQLH